MSVLEIPELLVAVLNHLNEPALKSCSLVCRMWREPATELLWAQVQDLDVLVNQSFSKETLQHFKPFPLVKLLNQSFSELPTVHSNPNQDEDEDEDHFPEESPFDEALKGFKQLSIDWPAETELFVKHTRHVSHLFHLANKWSGSYGLLVLHLLQEHQPAALRGVFPRLRALTIAGTRVPPITRTLTTMPSLRHVAFEANSPGGGIHDWIMACQDAPHLISFAIKYNNPKDSGSHQNNDLFDTVRFNEPFALLTTFICSRPWRHITIPGGLVGSRTLTALGSLDSLETLAINGSLRSYRWTRESARYAFKSVHTLRLIGAANANLYFARVVLPNVRHLELDYNPESKTMERDCPIAFFTTMVQACPNASSVAYTVRTKALGEEEFVEDFPESMFEHLLTHGSLERLIVRIPPTCSIRLSDEFLGRAARAWPRLQELDIDQKHSSRTKVTLQGLAPFARYCAELRSLQLGIEPGHVHTVFNAGLYTQEHEWGTGDRCSLTYLNVGCPAVFSATAVSTFFSVLFPKLIRIEHPESPDSDFYSRGDYFVWSQVVQAVRERDVDLDNLARMLRTQDLAAKHGSCDGDPAQFSIDDSDEDYWAYSGSEDENYSSDEDE